MGSAGWVDVCVDSISLCVCVCVCLCVCRCDLSSVISYARQQLLSTAAAVGIAGVFGAPFGGLLFSIEVTSTYYPMHSYFSSFVAALAAALTFITYATVVCIC